MSDAAIAMVFFTPEAIHEHFEGEDAFYAKVTSLSDAQIAEVGRTAKEWFLDSDDVWRTFHACLTEALEKIE